MKTLEDYKREFEEKFGITQIEWEYNADCEVVWQFIEDVVQEREREAVENTWIATQRSLDVYFAICNTLDETRMMTLGEYKRAMKEFREELKKQLRDIYDIYELYTESYLKQKEETK